MGSAAGKRSNVANVVVVGLDNSGKTTIINRLKPPEVRTIDVVPTVGFSVEKFRTKSLQLTAFDMSGQGRYRNLWEHYYRDCHGVIFVIDSSDKLRLAVARDELDQLLDHAEIRIVECRFFFLQIRWTLVTRCQAFAVRLLWSYHV
jgi:ADP-ribosylation factor-like protein 6